MVWVSSMTRMVPVRGRSPAGLVVAGVGQHDADVGERRFGQDAGHVAGGESGFQGRDVVELDHLGGERRVHLRADVGFPQFGLAVRTHGRERFVHRAVVAPVEHQDLGPAGEIPRDPQDEAVGVRGGESQLPQRQPEAALELAGHPDGVRGGHHGGDTVPGPLGQHVGHKGEGMAGHGPGIAQSEVDVLVAVDVGDAGAFCGLHEHGETSGPTGHPRHGHAGEEVLLGLLSQLRRLRVEVLEVGAFLGEAGAEQVAVDGSHGVPQEGRLVLRRRYRIFSPCARRTCT